jgi:ATP-dependent RNA helicase DDX1
MSQVLIFCRTNLDCSNLEKFFNHQSALFEQQNQKKSIEMKYSCRCLGGMLSMEERRRNLQLFKENEIRILICTDVAARGIDIDSLPYVINMTLPEEADDYIHRIGRVGRSDRMGLAISLVAIEDQEKVWYHKCSNRGIGCSNRQLIQDGGCTIWYNEANIVKKIEEKIMIPILKMVPTISSDSSSIGGSKAQAPGQGKQQNNKNNNSTIDWNLPEEIASLNCSYGEIATDSILHGGKDSTRVYMTEHMIKEVQQLATLEMKAQNMYLRMNDLLLSK